MNPGRNVTPPIGDLGRWIGTLIVFYLVAAAAAVTVAYARSPATALGALAGLAAAHGCWLVGSYWRMRKRAGRSQVALPAPLPEHEPRLALAALLDTLDCLEGAAFAAAADRSVPASFAEGLLLIEAKLLTALQQVGIDGSTPLGEPFDPRQHEAVVVIPKVGIPPNTVVSVERRGYTDHATGKVLRHPKVGVTPSAERQEPEADQGPAPPN